MSVTMDRVKQRDVREARWIEFLRGLTPEQLRSMGEQELVMHDAYVEGLTTLSSIRLMLSFGGPNG